MADLRSIQEILNQVFDATTGRLKMSFQGVLKPNLIASRSAANDLVIPAAGNSCIITGNTQINTISASGFPAGTFLILAFTGTPTIKHNTAGTGQKLLLAGSVDLVAAPNTVLTLWNDGTFWQEVSRKVA